MPFGSMPQTLFRPFSSMDNLELYNSSTSLCEGHRYNRKRCNRICCELVTGQFHFRGVDYDNIIATVDVRCIGRFILTHKNNRRLLRLNDREVCQRRQRDVPLTCDIFLFVIVVWRCPSICSLSYVSKLLNSYRGLRFLQFSHLYIFIYVSTLYVNLSQSFI